MEHKTLVTLRKKPFEFAINCSDILTNKDKYYLLNRSDQMYIQFMEKRLTKNSDEISQPQQVTIHHIANENNIERKIQLFVNFFTINDICSLYESQQNFINLSISETFISTLLDEANQFSLETKSNILNIFILLLPSNSIFLNSFLDCEFLFQFNQCLLKYINNFELLDSFFKCLINLLNNDTITTKVISNQLNLESYFEKVIMKLLDEQMIIQNKSKLIHQLLNVFPVLFYYLEENEYYKYYNIIRKVIELVIISFQNKNYKLLYHGIEVISFMPPTEYLLNSKLFQTLSFCIQRESTTHFELSNIFRICSFIIQFLNENKNIDINVSDNDLAILINYKTLDIVLNVIKLLDIEQNNNFYDDFIRDETELFIYAIRFFSDLFLIEREQLEPLLQLYFLQENGNYNDILLNFLKFSLDKDCFNLSIEIIHFYLKILESFYNNIKNVLLFTYKLHLHISKMFDINLRDKITIKILSLMDSILHFIDTNNGQYKYIKEDIIQTEFVEIIEYSQVNCRNEEIRTACEELFQKYFDKSEVDHNDCCNIQITI